MKKIKYSRFTMTLLVIIFAFSLSNCSVRLRSHNPSSHNASSYKAKKLPPGQAKKIYGGKSAKKYAPGHNK